MGERVHYYQGSIDVQEELARYLDDQSGKVAVSSGFLFLVAFFFTILTLGAGHPEQYVQARRYARASERQFDSTAAGDHG